jgi:methionine-rich copper-binding protein CopC
MGITQRLKRSFGVLFIAGIAVFAPITTASAHTELVSSVPAANEPVNAALPAISVTFSEPPLLEGSAIVVTDSTGQPVATEPATLEGATLTIPWPAALTPGTVNVEWRAASDDGHPVTGEFSFEYTAAAEGGVAPSADPEVTALGEATPYATPMPIAVTTGIAIDDSPAQATNYVRFIALGVVVALGVGIGIYLNRRNK